MNTDAESFQDPSARVFSNNDRTPRRLSEGAVAIDSKGQGRGQEKPPDRTRSNDLAAGVWVVALVLAVLYPALLYQWVFGVYAFRPALYASTTVILTILGAATCAVLYFLAFHRDIRRSAGVTAAIVVALLSWPIWNAIGDGDGVVRLNRVGSLAEVIPVLIAAAVLWIAVRYADRDRFVVVLIGMLIGVLITLGYAMNPRVVRASEVSLPVPPSAPNPNTVVLVLDGYARSDVLASQYGFDNSAFLDALTERGFRIRGDAIANYSVTHTSIASMVDMGYPFGEGPRSSESLDRMRRLLSGDGAIMHAFNNAGYETVMFENAWGGSFCGGVLDRCHRTGLFSRSLWSLGELSPFAAIQRMIVPHPFTSVGLQHIRELGGILDDDAAQPVFALAHVTVPHPPLQLSAACEFIVASDRTGMVLAFPDATEDERAEGRSRYVEQMRCINDEVAAAIDSLIAADEDVQIVILSDHGPDSRAQFARPVAEWTDDDLVERLSVLSAVRISDSCEEPRPARTSVNTIRRAVACALGTELVELPDRSFVAPAAQQLDESIVEVTDRMNSIAEQSDG